MAQAELARNANRLDRSKQAVAERREDTLSKELGTRVRSFYDEPDYDVIAEFQDRTSSLVAPAYPGYAQRWISKTKENGSHLLRMLNQEGWSLRNPKTVPNTAGLNTTKWGEYDTITVGNELVLCYMRKDLYDHKQEVKNRKMDEMTRDRTDFGRDLYGATKSMRNSLGDQYSMVTNVEQDSQPLINKSF